MNINMLPLKNNNFNIEQLKANKYILRRDLNKLVKLSLSEKLIAQKMLSLWFTHWRKVGTIAKDRESMSRITDLSIVTVSKTYKKMVELGLMTPVWFEKGGNKATRYIFHVIAMYGGKASSMLVSDDCKKANKINTYSDELVEALKELEHVFTVNKVYTYIYIIELIEKIKRLTATLREQDMISHYEYITFAMNKTCESTVTVKDIYELAMKAEKGKGLIRR